MLPNGQTPLQQASEVGGAILVIDDNDLLLELAGEFLSEAGYRVYTALNGEEALKLFSSKQQEIGLVITDMGLPGMSGGEVMLKIRDINPSTKCIAMSGFGGEDMIREVSKANPGTFLPKPFTREILLKAVGSMVGPPK